MTPGSSCIANAYSNNHDEIAAPGTGTMRKVALHVVDALGLVHVLILRLQALPFEALSSTEKSRYLANGISHELIGHLI